MFLLTFYSTALKGCRGIVFTHGVRLGGGLAGEKVCLGCFSEKVRCRKVILGRNIGLGVCVCEQYLSVTLILTLTYKILSGLYLGNRTV